MRKSFQVSVLGFAVLAVISCATYSNNSAVPKGSHRNPNQDAPAHAAAALAKQVMEVANECSGIRAKPFSSYSKFYFKDDGIAYGLKAGKEVKIKLEEGHKQYNPDGSLNYVATLNFFKSANGISDAVCPADGAQGNVGNNGGNAGGVPPVVGGNNPVPNAPAAGQCSTRGDADSVVLAMSWQPAFCEGKPDKPECKLAQFLTEDSYQAKNFTLHGLWPNKNACGQNYGFCEDVKKPESNFCQYPEVAIADHAIEKELERVMPSKAAGSCLERHEWHKHGTCQSLDTSKYFGRAITLLKNFNDSDVVALVRKHIKKPKLKKSELLKSLDDTFGDGASKNFIIVCKKSVLTEIQITLTSKIVSPELEDSQVTIKNLIDKSVKGYVRGCNDDITIDQTGPG